MKAGSKNLARKRVRSKVSPSQMTDNLLGVCACSLISDPNDDSKRVRRSLDDLPRFARAKDDQAGSERGRYSQPSAVLSAMLTFRSRTQKGLIEKAIVGRSSKAVVVQDAALLVIGSLRAMFTRRLAVGIELTPAEQRLYERVRIDRSR